MLSASSSQYSPYLASMAHYCWKTGLGLFGVEKILNQLILKIQFNWKKYFENHNHN